jgi:hypothetical protein
MARRAEAFFSAALPATSRITLKHTTRLRLKAIDYGRYDSYHHRILPRYNCA